MRKILVYILRVKHGIHYAHIATYINKEKTDPASFATDITVFSGICFRSMIGPEGLKSGKARLKKIQELRDLRNAIFHGKLMLSDHFDKFDDSKLDLMKDWITDVSNISFSKHGYNGISPINLAPEAIGTKDKYNFDAKCKYEDVGDYILKKQKEYKSEQKANKTLHPTARSRPVDQPL